MLIGVPDAARGRPSFSPPTRAEESPARRRPAVPAAHAGTRGAWAQPGTWRSPGRTAAVGGVHADQADPGAGPGRPGRWPSPGSRRTAGPCRPIRETWYPDATLANQPPLAATSPTSGRSGSANATWPRGPAGRRARSRRSGMLAILEDEVVNLGELRLYVGQGPDMTVDFMRLHTKVILAAVAEKPDEQVDEQLHTAVVATYRRALQSITSTAPFPFSSMAPSERPLACRRTASHTLGSSSTCPAWPWSHRRAATFTVSPQTSNW
jgi:hypothetical protein